jgi:hypothetical protein
MSTFRRQQSWSAKSATTVWADESGGEIAGRTVIIIAHRLARHEAPGQKRL